MEYSSFSEALAAWGLPETLLDAVDPDARPALWRELRAVLEASNSALPDGVHKAEADSQRQTTPPGASTEAGATGGAWAGRAPREPLPFIYQHYARPRFQQEQPSRLDLAGWHKKLRLALWMAAEALDALCALPKADEYVTLLAEQCAWIGQLYADLKRRAGPFFAPVIFQGEARLLQHRASAVVTDLLFAA